MQNSLHLNVMLKGGHTAKHQIDIIVIYVLTLDAF